MGRNLHDLTGQVFTRLTVIKRAPDKTRGTRIRQFWECLCECGKVLEVQPSNLVGGRTKSCGCLRKQPHKWDARTRKHGRYESPEYKMFNSARVRARLRGVAFDIELTDVVIPEYCPLLNIPLSVGDGQAHDGSPSLDRIDNTKGYIKGNVWVISRRANTIKSVASLEELESIALNLKEKMKQ